MDYCYTWMSHRYTDRPMHGQQHFMLLVQLYHVYLSLLHVHVMFTYHCYTCMPCLHITVTRACHVFISLLHVQSMFHVTVFMLYNCFLLLIWISRYWTCELLICNMWNPTSIVPVSRYIVPVSRYNVLCYQQSSGPVIMLPVSCTVICILLHCILDIADYNDNLGMRET